MIIERADTLGLSQLHQLRGYRAEPRARLRVLPLPRGEAADRDRPRAARHPGPALGPRRRHGDRDEGPRDPRRGQPARRRAVRPHRRCRVRPVRPAGGRGGPRVREMPSRAAGGASSCRSTRTCRTTTSPVRLRLEIYKRLAEVRPTEDVDLILEELADRYGEPPQEVSSAVAGRFRARLRRPGSVRSRSPARTCGSPPCRCPSRGWSG